MKNEGMPALNITFQAPYTFTNTEAAALVARMSVQPTENRKALIDTYIGALQDRRRVDTTRHAICARRSKRDRRAVKLEAEPQQRDSRK